MMTSIALALCVSACLVSLASPQRTPISGDVFGTTYPRRRSEYIPPLLRDETSTPATDSNTTFSIKPCSIPENADPKFSYPDFPECRNGKCKLCEPRRSSAVQVTRQPIRRPPLTKPLRRKPYINPRPATYLTRPRIPFRRPNFKLDRTGVQAPSHVIFTSPAESLPVQQYVVTAGNPNYINNNVGVIDMCPQPQLASFVAQPYQCPHVQPTHTIPPDFIVNILDSSEFCRKPMECRNTVSELLLKISLLQDRLRGFAHMETRLQVQAQLLGQIRLKIEEPKPVGASGLSGDVGILGVQGARGKRGPPGKCVKLGRPVDKTGAPGPRGVKGVDGPAGDKVCGCDGPRGPPGFFGFTIHGHPGPKGDKGPKGKRGRDFNPMA